MFKCFWKPFIGQVQVKFVIIFNFSISMRQVERGGSRGGGPNFIKREKKLPPLSHTHSHLAYTIGLTFI